MDNVKYRIDDVGLGHERREAIKKFARGNQYPYFLGLDCGSHCIVVVAPLNIDTVWDLYSFSRNLSVKINGHLFSIDDVISKNFHENVINKRNNWRV